MADEKQETIADIIAWLRRPREGENAYLTLWRDEIADRLEAAHKREKAAIEADALAVGGYVAATAEKSSAVGDCAKLRAALEKIAHYDDDDANMDDPYCADGHICADIARQALAAPPRNCDIYLTEEAVDAAAATVRDCWACSRIDMEAPCVFCMVRWLLAPAKEGGRDGK